MKILVFGATSAIAEGCCRIWAERGESLFLVGRDARRLDAIAADLRLRGAAAETYVADAREWMHHVAAVDAAFARLGGVDAALVAHGVLPDQEEAQRDAAYALQTFDVNFGSLLALTTELANRFEGQRAGVLCAISSVAGDRGRPSNYVYGAAKAATTALLSGLRARLHRSGVAVVTVKPGFVDTPMTARFRKGFLFVSPQRVARAIVRAMDARRDVVYVPWFWRPVLRVLREIPEPIFKRLRS
ncbi:MAG: SDR family oxidoreductase [Thermoplasmatota archaeon]